MKEAERSDANTNLHLGMLLIGFTGYFEWISMIGGFSVPFVFAKFVLLQIVLHLIGCLFLMWFILDTWNYMRIWNIFVVSALLPLILELVVIKLARRLS